MAVSRAEKNHAFLNAESKDSSGMRQNWVANFVVACCELADRGSFILKRDLPN